MFDKSFRIDAAEDLVMMSPVKGPGGAVLFEGNAAKPGILVYASEDGRTVRRELVPRKALWHKDSISSLGRAAVTLEHPPEPITPENVRQHLHGDLDGEIFETKGGHVRIRFALRTDDALSAAHNGKCYLSAGYGVLLDPTPGVDPEFGAYDAIQVAREYNHVAIVSHPRGGEQLSFRVDSESGPVLYGTYQEDSMPPVLLQAVQFAERYDSAQKAVRELVTDSLKEQFEQARNLSAFWDSFWQVNSILRDNVDKAMALDGKARAKALEEIGADLPALLRVLSEKYDETLGVVKSLRSDAAPAAAPPVPPKKKTPAAPPAAPPAGGAPTAPPAPGAPPAAPAKPPPAAPEGEAPAPEEDAAEEEPVDGEEGVEGEGEEMPAEGAEAEGVPGAEGAPPGAPPPPAADPAAEVPPVIPAPPPGGAAVTVDQVEKMFAAFEARLNAAIAPFLPPQVMGRVDSGALAAVERGRLRQRFDSLAADLAIGYVADRSLEDLAKAIVGASRPDLRFDHGADWIAAAQMVDPAATAAPQRKPDAPLTTRISSPYGPNPSE